MKRPPVILQNGGSCLSKIVLTISLNTASLAPPFAGYRLPCAFSVADYYAMLSDFPISHAVGTLPSFSPGFSPSCPSPPQRLRKLRVFSTIN